jgi:glycosyltransferase involved in cell wall biosynthesis
MKTNQKIVHLNLTGKGGAWIAANRVNTMLSQNGIDSKIVSLSKEVGSGSRDLPGWIDYKIATRSPVDYTTSFFRSIGMHPEVVGKAVQNASIVNLHWFPGHIRRSIWEKFKGKKLIWTMHDMQPFTAFCHHSNSCEQYQKDCSRCPQAMAWERPLIAREFIYRQEIVEQSDIEIICPSNWLTEKVQGAQIFLGKTVHTIPNPIDVQSIPPSLSVGKAQNLRIGILGSNYGKYKGSYKTLDFIRAIPMDLVNKIELRVLGSSYDELKYFTSKNVEFGSSIADVLTFMGDIDIFLYLSEFENLPNLLVELQVKGIPVAALPVGGVSETFVNGKSGWQVSEPRDFVEILKIVLVDRQLLLEFSRNAISNAREKFSFEKILPRYLDVYR